MNNEDKKFDEFPAWFYGPNGQSEIFNEEDEVPEGWVDHPSKLGKRAVGKKLEQTPGQTEGENEDDNDDDNEVLIEKLAAGKSHRELVEILEDAQKKNDALEFLKNWPKAKLARTIVENEIEYTLDDAE